jgi:hypothetical protein
MATRWPCHTVGWVAAATVILLTGGPSQGQPLPWEITVAEIEAARIRQLAQRLSKENVLFQLHLGDARKSDLVATVGLIDRILETLEQGAPGYAIPAAWTPALREQLQRVDTAWGPLRKMALASPYEYLQATRQFMPLDDRRSDPLLLRYFDNLSLDLVAESEKLLALYDDACRGSGLEICATASIVGYNAMLVERATKEAVFVVAGIDASKNRKLLAETLGAYEKQMKANDSDATFRAALSPARGEAGKAATEMLTSLRGDWARVRAEFTMLDAGDEENFDLRRLLSGQKTLIQKIERFTAVIVQFANVTYGT